METKPLNHAEPHILEIRDVIKQYDDKPVLRGISFNVRKHEFFTIVGPSGCGKTTILNIINGIIKADAGTVSINAKNVNKIPAYKRNVNTVFQNYALFEHLDVFNNIAFGPRLRKQKRRDYEADIDFYLKLVNMSACKYKKISELSGGQKQRVAIARALINKPDILLLDEPMSALDVNLRQNMQQELKKIQRKTGITFILITHDQTEALMLSDRIMVMSQGTIEQIGTPTEVYNEPDNMWVAQFIGDSNIISDAVFVKDKVVKFDGQEFACLDTNFGQKETRIDVCLRPEDIIIKAPQTGFIEGVVIEKKFKGMTYYVNVKTKHRTFLIITTQDLALQQKISLAWNIDALHVMWKMIED